MIDTVHAVQTPEGVDLALRVAGPVPRALAWGVDAFLQGGIALALQIADLGGRVRHGRVRRVGHRFIRHINALSYQLSAWLPATSY